METIKILNGTGKTPLRNFWNHIHFHPTDAIEDEWGIEILDQVAADKVAKSVRMYAMLEDIVTMDDDGNLCYDFTLNDARLDYMIEKGFDILICYNFIPPCIALNKDEINSVSVRSTRYKGKMIVTSPPRDYALWEEVCYRYTEHIVARYGEERVSQWLLQCFNEPDIGVFWMRDKDAITELDERLDEYMKLYRSFVSGIEKVSKNLKLGGPVRACVQEFMDKFLKRVAEENLRLDYVTFHAYGTSPDFINEGSCLLNHANSLPDINGVLELCEKYGFSHLPIVIDEWGAASMGFYTLEKCPQLLMRDNEEYAAYFAKMITLYSDENLAVDRIMMCLSGQHDWADEEFRGSRSLFSKSGYPKPIYNAYKLSAMLKNNKLANENPNSDVSVLATEDDAGNISILLGYASEHYDQKMPVAELKLALQNPGDYKAYIWRIDVETANAMAAYEKYAGDRDAIMQASRVARVELGDVRDAIDLTLHSTSCILLELVKN